jgi:hypothetical protein
MPLRSGVSLWRPRRGLWRTRRIGHALRRRPAMRRATLTGRAGNTYGCRPTTCTRPPTLTGRRRGTGRASWRGRVALLRTWDGLGSTRRSRHAVRRSRTLRRGPALWRTHRTGHALRRRPALRRPALTGRAGNTYGCRPTTCTRPPALTGRRRGTGWTPRRDRITLRRPGSGLWDMRRSRHTLWRRPVLRPARRLGHALRRRAILRPAGIVTGAGDGYGEGVGDRLTGGRDGGGGVVCGRTGGHRCRLGEDPGVTVRH